MSEPHSFSNADSAPYWQAAAKGSLILQKCEDCGKLQFPPRHHCASCWNANLVWQQSEGKGRIESLSIVRRAPLEAFRDKVPYVVAAITLEDGPRMITNIVGDGALQSQIGDQVKVTFETNDNGEVLPQFSLV